MNGKEMWKNIERLRKEIEKGNAVAFIWHVGDVLGLADGLEIELSEEEARTILYNVRRGHDCMIGANWEVIDYYLREYVRERESTA